MSFNRVLVLLALTTVFVVVVVVVIVTRCLQHYYIDIIGALWFRTA